MPGNLVLTGCAAAAIVTSRGNAPVSAALRTPGAGGGGGGGDAGWEARIADPNVVWYHGFNSAAEVNQFRWTGGYSGGNDPAGNGSGAGFLTHVASGGPDGGGFLRSQYPSGETAGRGNSYWWRPFNPLTGATNGRGSNDPGASGALAPAAFNASDGSSTTYTWSLTASNPGWYGSAADQAAAPEDYQGGEFYLQIRVRRAQTPGAPPDTETYTSITGKNVWLTTTASSFVAQELVTYGQSVGNGDTVGVQSRHNVYVGQNFTSLTGQPNGTVTVSNISLDWRYSGGWDTLLYHVTPGTNGGTGANRTRVEVWAQHDPALFPAEAGVYTKIWDVTYTQGYSTGTNSSGAPLIPGWNALILGSYHNGSAFASSFNFDYGQIIFSKATIAAPGGLSAPVALVGAASAAARAVGNLSTAPGGGSALADLAASMSAGTWAELTTTGANAAFFQSGASGSILAYTTGAAWDGVNQRVHVVGQYHGMGALRSIMLDLATNAWTVVQSALESGGHGYDHVECDPRNGDAYYHPYGLGTDRPVYKYTHASGTWNTSFVTLSQYRGSTNGSCTWTGSLTGFSGPVNVLLDCEFGNWFGIAYDTLDNGGSQSWTVLGDTPINGSLHVVCEYSAVHNCAVGGGGNNNDFEIWRLNSNQTVTQLTDCPRAFGTQRGLLNVDPVTGNFLVLASDGTFWELNPTGAGTWTQLTGSRAVPSGFFPPRGDTNSTSAGVSIIGHDVVLYFSTDTSGNARTWLYKHA